MDTIYALASASGRAGVAVIRISGLNAVRSFEAFGVSAPPNRELRLRHLVDSSGAPLDDALSVFMPGPTTFTGEDVVELHLHGSTAVTRSVLNVLSGVDGFRLAEPGEFTRRALENNRLDLTQVEGLADLIEAETEAQRLQAQRSLRGELSERVEMWRAKLIRAAALLEATIDFADEDVPVDVSPEVSSLVSDVLADLKTQIAGVTVAERIRSGFEVAIVGPPNAGKSTLLNALARRDVAITSEIAGTTRDVIEVRAEIAGLPVTILDTAGLRETSDEVERIGVTRAQERAEAADLRIFLMEDDDHLLVMRLENDIVATPKVDLVPGKRNGVSGKTGEGLAWLEGEIARVLGERERSVGLATHHRHAVAMSSASEHLETANDYLQSVSGVTELAAEELRFSARALEALVGRIDVENLLDEIFASFCLGK